MEEIMLSKIKNYMLSLGFTPNLAGYNMLAELIYLAATGEDILPLKYVGYRKLSEKYLKSADTIEKDIQNAISAAWLKAEVDRLYSEFGETVDQKKGKPSNKQFVFTALESLMKA